MNQDKSNYKGLSRRQIHPFVKECILLLTLLIVLLRPGLQGPVYIYLAWLATIWFFWIINGVDIRRVSTTFLIGVMLSIVLIISQGFLFKPGETSKILFKLFDIYVGGRNIGIFTLEGLIAGIIGSLKIFCVISSAQMFVTTTNIEDFAYTLNKLKIPYMLTFMMVTGMRFVPLVEKTWHEILDARRLRGMDIDNLGILKKIVHLYPQSLIPLILSLFKMGLHLDIAIATRGFNTKSKKTLYYSVPMRIADYMILLVLLSLFAFECFLLLK